MDCKCFKYKKQTKRTFSATCGVGGVDKLQPLVEFLGALKESTSQGVVRDNPAKGVDCETAFSRRDESDNESDDDES